MKILTVDVGGTFIKYARMNEDREITSRGMIDTPQDGREALIEALASLYAAETVDGIALSLPGIIDSENGYIAMGGALRYNDGFHLRQALHARCPVPIVLENDAKCAALAEAADGSLKDVPNGMVLIFGTMIGGAIIRDHMLFRGSHFSAGEVSYLITDRDGLPSADGVWGNRCGVPRLCRQYAQEKGLSEKNVDGKTVFEAVNAGDEIAQACLQRYASEIAVQIFNLQTVYDPDRFALGGGISAQPVLIDTIREKLRQLYSACPYKVHQAEVVPCRYQNDANLYGALHCFLSTTAAQES